jgi:exopolyphosphatase / guanosine-5'-triphosphate,3'-diphosphate pyrophosphatase
MRPRRRAVIDVGTNSIKLLVGDVTNGVVHPVDERSEQTRLGAGFYETHELQAVPMTRTASAVARFAAMARDLEAESVRVIATSAARDARNGAALAEAVRRASGLRMEIISGDQEAEWVFAGVATDPHLQGGRLLILDVGGGSTEFILGEQGHPSFRESFALGSVRLHEALQPADPPTPADIATAREWLKNFFDSKIGPAMETLLSRAAREHVQLVGTGGATTILARIEHRAESFDRAQIEGTVLKRDQIFDAMMRLWGMSLADRRKLPGLPPNRADVILMGVAIYETVMEHFDFPDLYVSTRGLRYGALMDRDLTGSSRAP